MVRPSLMDLRFTGDHWLVQSGEGRCTLYLGDYRLAGIRALTIDVQSLNQVLDRIRHPRHRRTA